MSLNYRQPLTIYIIKTLVQTCILLSITLLSGPEAWASEYKNIDSSSQLKNPHLHSQNNRMPAPTDAPVQIRISEF